MISKKSPACRQAGFTLFELLVSISIIGILVAVASTAYGAAQKKARDARRMEDLNGIQKAAEQYYGGNSYTYPADKPFGATYMQNWPKDPKSGDDYTYLPDVPATGGYCVCVELDNKTGGNSTDSLCGAFVANGGSYYCVKNQQ